MENNALMFGWTTTETEAQALELADGLVEATLAACVQVDGPINSVFVWQGQAVRQPEYRLLVKFPAHHAAAIQAWLVDQHPYETPQWVTVAAADALPAYAAWVHECCPPKP